MIIVLAPVAFRAVGIAVTKLESFSDFGTFRIRAEGRIGRELVYRIRGARWIA
jgi:hypothetical protein